LKGLRVQYNARKQKGETPKLSAQYPDDPLAHLHYGLFVQSTAALLFACVAAGSSSASIRARAIGHASMFVMIPETTGFMMSSGSHQIKS
jgi:hypothetical protein